MKININQIGDFDKFEELPKKIKIKKKPKTDQKSDKPKINKENQDDLL